MKTQLALETEAKIKDHYPKLAQFYQEYMGNFQFTRRKLRENLGDVLNWLEEHEHYFLLHQEDWFYLTDITDSLL
jgi:hypothetical protein